MAGDWIKWVKGLAKRPEVIDISVTLGLTRHAVAGLLCEVWEWADDNVDPADTSVSCPGFVRMRSASCHTINGLVGVAGLAEAMTAVGWLEVREGSIVFPRFGRHNGKHAKGRALDAERKRTERRSRKQNVPEMSGHEPDTNRTRGEERRGEIKKQTNTGPPGGEDFHSKALTFLKDWNATKGTRKCGLLPSDLSCYAALAERINGPNWFERYPDALAKFPLRGLPDGMDIKKFVEERTLWEILENSYDYTPRGQSRAGASPKDFDIHAALKASR